MKIIGLCGQSGAGKTTALEAFSEEGFFCVNCDSLARLVTEKGAPCLDELRGCFGEGIIRSDGSLDRKSLASLAFSSEDGHRRLNEITHRHILYELEKRIDEAREKNAPAIVIDAPLLFESGLDKRCDEVVAVCADRSVRLERIMERDGITEKEALSRLSRQTDEEELVKRSGFVIYNNKDKAQLKEQVSELVRKIGDNIE